MEKRFLKASLIFLPMVIYLSLMFHAIDNICDEPDTITSRLETVMQNRDGNHELNISRALQNLAKRYDELEQQKNNLLSLVRGFMNRNSLSENRKQFLSEIKKIVHQNDEIIAGTKTQSQRHDSGIVKPKFMFNCENINEITLKQKVGHGVTKQAFLGYYKGEPVAVKMVTRHQKDVRMCLQKLPPDDQSRRHECFTFSNMKLMKEILLLEQMDHPGFIKLLGYCVRSEESDSTDLSEHGITAVYEYGRRLNVANLQFNTFGSRLRHAIDLADFLSYLDKSPLGSLRVRDFKEAHFLLVNNSIKMIDLDDVDNLEPSCDVYFDTQDTIYENASFVKQNTCGFDLPCYMGLCIGFNAKNNLKMMNRIFFSRLLHTKLYPAIVTEPLTDLIARIDSSTISASDIVLELQKIQKHLFSKYGSFV